MDLELLKLLLDQAGGVLIALLLILRIESKLDSLTDAMLRLSEAINQPRVKCSYTTNLHIYAMDRFFR